LDEQEIRRLLLATAARDVDAFAGPLRFLAPVLDDVVEFVQATPPR
jgi:hypothetical protein